MYGDYMILNTFQSFYNILYYTKNKIHTAMDFFESTCSSIEEYCSHQ